MFELSVVNGWPVAKVAAALGVGVTQVYMARHRLSRQLEKEIQHLERNLV
jgi:DNA-directed RNA polymerase specialized sigma24 family protein